MLQAVELGLASQICGGKSHVSASLAYSESWQLKFSIVAQLFSKDCAARHLWFSSLEETV